MVERSSKISPINMGCLQVGTGLGKGDRVQENTNSVRSEFSSGDFEYS